MALEMKQLAQEVPTSVVGTAAGETFPLRGEKLMDVLPRGRPGPPASAGGGASSGSSSASASAPGAGRGEALGLAAWLLGGLSVIYCLLLCFWGIDIARHGEVLDDVVDNPLARVAFATPILWGFVVVEVFLGLPSKLLLARRTYLVLGHRRRDCLDTRHGALAAWGCAIFLPLLVLVGLFATPISACAEGFPAFPKGGFCRCEAWDRSVTGTPHYGVTAAEQEEVLIAFSGDMGGDTGEDVKVYRLMREEGASAVVVNGDLEYLAGRREAGRWRDRVEANVGSATFYITAGNHDTAAWRDYQEQTAQHWLSRNVTQCRGTVGVRNVCTHRGVALLLSGIGSTCGGPAKEHGAFFEEALAEARAEGARGPRGAAWPVCVFHPQQHSLQTGSKRDTTGWQAYRTCMKHGALIINGHEHVYARTHELGLLLQQGSDTVELSRKVPAFSGRKDAAELRENQSLVVLAGIGGHEIRGASEEALSKAWWAATWNRKKVIQDGDFTQRDANHGAFFCRFNLGGDPSLARCYFKDIAGHLVDDFYIHRST